MKAVAGAAIGLTLLVGCAAAPALRSANNAPTRPSGTGARSVGPAGRTSAKPSSPASSAAAVTTSPVSAPSRPLHFQQRLLGLAFADGQHGMVITRSCGTGTCGVHAVTTDDGGSSWHVAGTAPAPAESYGVQLLLPDPRDAWLLDASTAGHSALWASHDGGGTWSRIDVPSTVSALAAVGDTVWLVDERTCAGAAQGVPRCNPSIDQTPVRGGAVTVLSQPPTRHQPIVTVAEGPGAQRYLTAGTVGATDHVVLASTDGGRTWQPVADPCGGLNVEVAASPASSPVWALCFGEPGAGQMVKHLQVSGDGGRHWSRRPDPPWAGYGTTLSVFSTTVAWLSGSVRGDVYRTTDGGTTWSDVLAGRVGDAAGAPAYDFDAIDASHAVVAIAGSVDGHPLVLRTADGGRSWQPLTMPL